MLICDSCERKSTKENPIVHLDIAAVVGSQDKQILSVDVCPSCLARVKEALPAAVDGAVAKAKEKAKGQQK